MESRRKSRSLMTLLCMVMLSIRGAMGLTQNLCSTDNTASTPSNQSEWQSNGLCSDFCRSGYAVAIVQWQSCWCSNYLPADQLSLSQCDHYCPGYREEDCGSQDQGTFGYLLLDIKPSGTQGAGGSAPTKSSTTTTTTSELSSSVAVTSSTTSSTSKNSPSSAMTMFTTKSVSTDSAGVVITQTVVATSYVGDPQSQDRNTETTKSTVSPGAIAGGVVGGILGLALIVAGVIFFFWRQRRQQMSQYGGSEAGNSGVTRNTSVLSKTGLLGSAEKGYMGPVHTSSQRSGNGMDPENTTPVSERRHSKPLFYDQRLNPSALMDNDNGSRASVGTMQDNRDYTRQLNVRNPDPDSDRE